jgi:hypothetical protein
MLQGPHLEKLRQFRAEYHLVDVLRWRAKFDRCRLFAHFGSKADAASPLVARRTRHTWRSKPDSPPSPNPERPAEIDPTPLRLGSVLFEAAVSAQIQEAQGRHQTSEYFARLGVPHLRRRQLCGDRADSQVGGGRREVNARHLRTDSRLG